MQWTIATLLLRPGRGAAYCDQFVCLSVCLSASISLEPIFTKFFVRIPCGRGSILLWRHCDTLCTSGFMDDVKFGRSGPYGNAWKPGPSTYYHYRRCDTGAESDVYEISASAMLARHLYYECLANKALADIGLVVSNIGAFVTDNMTIEH